MKASRPPRFEPPAPDFAYRNAADRYNAHAPFTFTPYHCPFTFTAPLISVPPLCPGTEAEDAGEHGSDSDSDSDSEEAAAGPPDCVAGEVVLRMPPAVWLVVAVG